MFQLGKGKYEAEFDLLKIIRAVRNFDNYYEFLNIDAESKAKIEYSEKNILSLDSNYSDSLEED